MCTEDSGSISYRYTGDQVGDFNYTGDYNFVAGGLPGSNLSAGTTVGVFNPNTLSRRPWLALNARFNDLLLDAAYPIINLQWFVEITLEPSVIFRLSDRSFYVQDSTGIDKFYEARVERAPAINVTLGEWLNPSYEISDLTFTINNRDGYFNPYLPQGESFRQWAGASLIVKVGFGDKYDNYFTLFDGQVTSKQGLTTTRDSIEVRAFDKLDRDEVPIPTNTFNSDIYPDIDEDSAGKPIPLIYGDWTENVPESGAVSAYCTNAGDTEATEYEFKVSDIAMESIDSVWLHRGRRKEGEPGGPIQFDNAELTFTLEDGKFTVPIGSEVFSSEAVLYDNQGAGAGSGLNLITAKDASINFVEQRIQTGDRVLKRKTGEYAAISSITNTQLNLSGGITFAQDDEYIVLTKKYKFIKGDKISVVCEGKNLNLISITRLSDIDTSLTQPNGISLSFDSTYWITDDNTQKVYNLTFDGAVIQEIAYSSIDASITRLTGVSVANDNWIWVIDPDAAKIYRYNYADNGVGLSFTTADVSGIGTLLTDLSGIVAKSDNKIWIVDKGIDTLYEIDPFLSVPLVLTTFTRTAFDTLAVELTDVGYDEQEEQVVVIDRSTNKFYRLNETNGALISSFSLSLLGDNVAFPTGVSMAQDGTIFIVDQGTLSVYNYTDLAYASVNPCFIARDLIQKFGGHTYEEFDLSWMQTARQLSTYEARAVIKDKTNVITYINSLLRQFNVAFHLRFNKYSLFWITFENFVTTGKLVKEKDIREASFRPTKENDQYFNSAVANYDKRDFQGRNLVSDTYVSTAGVSFAGKEVNKKLDLPNIYRRTDLDRLMPLFIRLAVPEPEFIEATFGFRLIRVQMQEFVTLNFYDDPNLESGVVESGRRFDNIPCMIRKIAYDLNVMSVTMKLWSLGNTPFPDYVPPGRTVGGWEDKITLSSLGRLGRISPIGTITGSSDDTLTIEDVNGQDAEERTDADAGLAWVPGYKIDLINGSTKAIVQTLTIESVSGGVITFVEEFDDAVSNTVENGAGFITSGHYIQYASYLDASIGQRSIFASFSKPTSNYPTSRAQEVEEQRGGLHSFADGGLPYILFPEDYIEY